MDDNYVARQLARLTAKVDAALNLIVIGLAGFGLPRISTEIAKSYGLSDGWSHFAAFVLLFAVIGMITRNAYRD